MKMSFRWYGESDPVSLQYIRQIPNMKSIVSAVYDVKPGEVWPEESLAKMKKQCDDNGLVFDVVESIPVHEDIKLGRGEVDKLIEVYCENIRRCAKYGVKCVTYNFMPVFDWTRTQLDKEAPDGSTSLVMYWEQMKGLDPLKDDIHLPGWDSSYTQDEVRELISAYGEIGAEGLWANLERFLKKVIPVAEECGVRMAIHPDDPPYPIFGLPRIITNEENLDRMLAIVDSPANSLCLCTGSLGCASSNDVVAITSKVKSEIGKDYTQNSGVRDEDYRSLPLSTSEKILAFHHCIPIKFESDTFLVKYYVVDDGINKNSTIQKYFRKYFSGFNIKANELTLFLIGDGTARN